METRRHRHRPRPRHRDRPQHARGLRQADPLHRVRVESLTAGANLGAPLRQGHPGPHGVRQDARLHEADRRVGATPLGVEMAGNLGHRGLQVDFIDEGPGCWRCSTPTSPEPVHESFEKRGGRSTSARASRVFAGDGRVARCRPRRASWCDVVICACKLPSATLAEAAGLGGRDHRRADRRRADAHLGATAWAAGDVVEVPHGLDAPDPRPHRLARLRAGPDRGVQRRGRDLVYDPVGSRGAWWRATTIGGFSIGETSPPRWASPTCGQGRRRVARATSRAIYRTHVKLLADPAR